MGRFAHRLLEWLGRWLGATIVFICVMGSGCERACLTRQEQQLGERALFEAAELVRVCPRRVAGEQSADAAAWIASRLPSCEVRKQTFQTPYGVMTNVVAWRSRILERKAPVLVLASHYDTKYGIADFVGANDGASTVGLLIALVEMTELPIVVLFLDGEECRQRYSEEDGLHGAWFAAKKGLSELGWASKSGLPVLVLDMLGDRGFTPGVAENGTLYLKQVIRQAAKGIGVSLSEFGVVVDDHVPFLAQQWQAADLIDFEYGPENAWWHTTEDTVDKLSAESLARGAALILRVVECLEQVNR